LARGWESKAVADQIEEGNSQKDQARVDPASPEDRERQDQLNSLLLSKSRLLQQLERATHPAHRKVLLNGLKAIEKQIDDIISSDTLTNA
jgi:hypothetical protein